MILSAGIQLIQSALDWNYTVSANYPVSWSSDPEYASTGDCDRAPGTFIGWDFTDPDDPDGIIQNLPSVISAGLQILGMLAQGIATGLPSSWRRLFS